MAEKRIVDQWYFPLIILGVIAIGVLWLNYTPLGQIVNWLISPH
jgi:hypothetical protein